MSTADKPFGVAWIGGRALVGLAAVLFIVSTTFPIVASVWPMGRVSIWAGMVDVGLAFVLVLLAMWIEARGRGGVDDRTRRASHRGYRVVMSVPLVLLVTFFLAPHVFRWDVLLPGLAWRAWLLCYSLPAACAVWMGEPAAAGAAIERETR